MSDSLLAAAKLWDALSEHFFIDERGVLEYSDFLELAETCGLLTQTPYDPTLHADVAYAAECERGDSIYVPTELGARLRAVAQESPP